MLLSEVRKRTAAVIPDVEWACHAPLIERVWKAKRDHDAVVLAHNYQRPEIFFGISDITGDSLALARAATEIEASTVVMCGVHFMAETVKLLNPKKRVLLPDLEAGCSLASSITAEEVRRLKGEHPGVPVVTYVNTTADVKAESDVCCTSANAVDIVRALGAERVILIPDEYLGRYIASQLEGVDVILPKGRCEVHERFTADDVRLLRRDFDDLCVVSHPECSPEVIAASDFVGSTTAMVTYLERTRPRHVALLTECSMGDNIAAQLEGVEIVRPCNLCPHMARITLEKVVSALEHGRHEIEVPADVAEGARRSLSRMLGLTPRGRP